MGNFTVPILDWDGTRGLLWVGFSNIPRLRVSHTGYFGFFGYLRGIIQPLILGAASHDGIETGRLVLTMAQTQELEIGKGNSEIRNRKAPEEEIAKKQAGGFNISSQVLNRPLHLGGAGGREPLRLEREAAPGGQGLGAVAGHEGDQHGVHPAQPHLPRQLPLLAALHEGAQPPPGKDRFISVELVDESLFDWNVKLHQVDKDSVLWQDMKETNTEFILLNLTFPDNFPFSPPFMRVLSPRLENGYVLDGGAICMELLTPRGWSSAYTVEAVMRQFAASLVKGQGRICRKAGKSKKSFSRKEAEATFKSLVKTHEKYGWVTPPVSDG
nr:ubiquitin-conjugating enzyme E2Q-like protein 1 [Pelodiscus sinensis]|eukprot:XP_006127374.1 ubiquitin-conjugating enzyme E2Q-like protein 1 [Pelodiscus sinensis]